MIENGVSSAVVPLRVLAANEYSPNLGERGGGYVLAASIWGYTIASTRLNEYPGLNEYPCTRDLVRPCLVLKAATNIL